jgi:hypothetical protein
MGRRPIGDKAMTAAERQRRMRSRREGEIVSLRNKIQSLGFSREAPHDD